MTYWSHSPYSPEYTSTYYSPIDNTTDRNDPNDATGTQTVMSMRRLTWQPPRPTSMRPTSHTHTERNSPLSIQSNATPTSAGVSASAVIPATPSATDTASMTTTASIMINASTPTTTTAATTPSASGNNIQTELPIMTEGVTDTANSNNNNDVMYDAAGLPATTIEMTETTVEGYTVDLFAAPPAPTCYEYYVPTYYQYDYNNHNGTHAGNAIPAGAAQPMPFPPPPQPMSYVGPYYVPMTPYEAQPPITTINTTGIPDAMPSPANERSGEPYRYTNEVYGCYRQAYPINSWMHTPHPPYSPAEYYQFAVQQYEQMQQFLPPMMGWSPSNADDAYDEYDENQETLSSRSVLYSVAASLTPASLCHYAMRHCLLCGRPGHCYVDCGLYDGTMLCLYAEQTSKVYVMRHSQWLRSARMGDIVRFAQRALRSPCNTFHLWLDGVSFAAMDRDNVTPSSETSLQQSVMRQAWRRRRAMMQGNTSNSNNNERTAYISGLCTGCAGLSRAFLSRRCCYYQVLPGRALYISRVREATQSTTASVTVSPSTAPAASPRRETNTELDERNASGTTGNATTTEVQQGCHTQTEDRRTGRMMEQASRSVSDISVITADLSQPPPSLDTTQQQQQPLMKEEEDGVTLQNNNTITTAVQRVDKANNSSTATAGKITTVTVTQQSHNCIATREAAAAARRVCTLHIKFIPPHMTTGRLRQLLTFFGTLQRVRLLAPSEFYTLRKPFLLCFVEYSTAQEATMMIRYLHGCRVSRDFTLAAEQPRAAIANRHLSDFDAITGQPCIFGLSHSALQEVQRRYNLPCVTWGMDSMTCAEAAARFDISVDLALVQRRGSNNTAPNSNKTFIVPAPRSERMTSRTSSRHEESGSEAHVRTRGNNNNSSTQRSGSTGAQSRCSTQSHSSNSSLLLHASRLHEVTRRPEPSEKGKVTQTTFTKPPLSTVTTNIRNTPRKAKPTEQQPELQKEQQKIEVKAASTATTEVLHTDEEEEYNKTDEQDDALQLTRAMVREHTAHYALHSEPTAFFSALRLVETALHAVRERAATIAANTFCHIITRTTTTTKHTDNHTNIMSQREGISVSLLHLELLCDEVALFVSDGEVREACAVAKQAVGVVQSTLTVLTDNATTSNAITSLYGCDIYTSTPLSEQSYHAGHLELALQESFLSSINNTNKNNRVTPRRGRECSDMKRYVRLEYVHCALHRLLYILLLLDTLMRSKWSTEVRYTELDEDRNNKSNRSSTKENDALTSSDMATGGSAEFVLRTMLHVLRAIRRLFRHTLAPLILPHTIEEDGTGSDSVKDTALSFLQVYCHNVQDVLVHDVQDILEPHVTSLSIREGATRRSSAKKHTAMYKPGALLARLQPDVGSFALTILDGKTVTFFT